MNITGLIGKLGGIGQLVKLFEQPGKAVALAVNVMPGIAHALGRHKIHAEIAARAAYISKATLEDIERACLAQRDLTPEEIAAHDQLELQLLMVVRDHLNKFPKTAEGMNLEKLAAAFGLAPRPAISPPGHDAAVKAERDATATTARNGHAGASDT